MVVLLLGVAALPAQASVGSKGFPVRRTVRGALSGSGSSTLDSAGGHPILSSDSSGSLAATFLGTATYQLSVGDTGTRRVVGLTITAPSGTLHLGAGPFIDSALSDEPLSITGGTGLLALASGELWLHDYTKTDVDCLPSPPAPAPNIFCTWNETATISGTILLRLQPPPRYRTRA